VCCKASDYEFSSAGAPQKLMKARCSEGIGQRFGDDGFVVAWSEFCDDRNSGTVRIEDRTALAAMVNHMKYWDIALACQLKQPTYLDDGFIDALETQEAINIFSLWVDHY
jgi:hypothetical protein